MSLRRLKVETIDLFQLHRIDPKADRGRAIRGAEDLQDEGKVRHSDFPRSRSRRSSPPGSTSPSRPCRTATT